MPNSVQDFVLSRFIILFHPYIILVVYYMTHFGRPRRRWEDNIKMHLQEVICGGMDWFELAQDGDRWRALANAVMNFLVA